MNALPAENKATIPQFLLLDDNLLYKIMTYIEQSTETSGYICQTLFLLNHETHTELQTNRPNLWSNILQIEYEQELLTFDINNKKRRMSKRICSRRSAIVQVREAHWLLCHRTRTAHFRLTEMAHNKRYPLTLQRLRAIFKELGPKLRCNHPVDIGGTFLVEACRARHVAESVIVSCVRELVEKRGSLPDIASGAGPGKNGAGGLTPLCIAAARGMASVVRYLLKVGASPVVKGTGRFRLFCNGSKSIHCRNVTPLEFAKAMMDAEQMEGAAADALRSLNSCIRILSKVT